MNITSSRVLPITDEEEVAWNMQLYAPWFYQNKVTSDMKEREGFNNKTQQNTKLVSSDVIDLMAKQAYK